MRLAAEHAIASAGWTTVARVPPIAAGAVHVWCAETAPLRHRVHSLARVLDSHERARAASFHSAVDSERYVVAHGVLRHLLARYIAEDPAAVEFETGAQGKPRLAPRFCSSGVTFNMSHTRDLVVFAFGRGRAVGVDVEQWADAEYLELARRYFSPREGAALAALGPDAVRRGFFACWSRKEAYIKATGLGLSRGLDYFDVSLAPNGGAALLADRTVTDAVARWRLQDLGFRSGHSGAIVAEGQEWELQRFTVSEAVLE